MIRAFVALDLPEPVRQQLGRQAEELKELGLDGRVVRPESTHLTLRFLGQIGSDAVSQWEERLKGEADVTEPFHLEIGGLGAFPHLARPRVVWAGVSLPAPLARLQKGVETIARELGGDPEKRPYKPHLTLMRLKSQRNLKELVRYVSERGAGFSCPTVAIEAVHLYRSELRPDGARYHRLCSAWLRGSPAPAV